MCNYLKEQDLYHSLHHLQVFLCDFINAGLTMIKLFNRNRTNYIDLHEKRLSYLENASECFQKAKIDTEQSMIKVQRFDCVFQSKLKFTVFLNKS